VGAVGRFSLRHRSPSPGASLAAVTMAAVRVARSPPVLAASGVAAWASSLLMPSLIHRRPLCSTTSLPLAARGALAFAGFGLGGHVTPTTFLSQPANTQHRLSTSAQRVVLFAVLPWPGRSPALTRAVRSPRQRLRLPRSDFAAVLGPLAVPGFPRAGGPGPPRPRNLFGQGVFLRRPGAFPAKSSRRFRYPPGSVCKFKLDKARSLPRACTWFRRRPLA